jgi:magnesium transporter
MLYEFNNGLKNIKIRDIKKEHLTVGLITLKQLKENNDLFKFSSATINDCEEENHKYRNTIDIYDGYSFGIMTVINAADDLSIKDRIGFYIKNNLFLLVEIMDNDKSVQKILEYAVKRYHYTTMTLEKVIFSVFENLINNDRKVLEQIEYHIDEMEDVLIAGNVNKNFNGEILVLKKRLLGLKNYYEQIIDVGEELQENENDIFAEEDLRYFKMFTDKATRLSNNVQMLREKLVQLRDAYHAALDYNLNSIMKMFTVVTTIFLPLTLIVGWYGMNFTTMPELTWKYGYVGVIVLSIVVVIGILWYYKKKKLL